MKLKLLLLAAISLLFSICLFAQKKKKGAIPERMVCKFGDVKPEDFRPTAYAVDSSADAVYLFDGGSAKFEGNNNGFFNVVHNVHVRIRLLKKNSFDDLGKVEIPIYKPNATSDEQRLSDLQATTYNLDNGQVTATKIDKASFFKEKDGEMQVVKFTFPNLKEGAIIEYAYTISSPGGYLPGWVFQGNYPRLWSEYETEVPQFYDYVVIKQGYVPYAIDTVKVLHDNYNITSNGGTGSMHIYNISSNTVNNVWAMKNVPALRRESFTTTISNHVAKIDFQLSAIRYPEMPPKMIMNNWYDVAADLMKDEDFGGTLTHTNNFFDDDIKAATANAKTGEEKAKSIYEWVRDNYSCTDFDAKYLSQPIKKTYQTKKGNVADINLMLTAMLMSQGMEAYPVLLSTCHHGKAYEMYPILSKFNYVICQLKIDDKRYLLDAASSRLGFNHLDADCYNGFARVINPSLPELIQLQADSLREKEFTSVFIANNSDNKMLASVSDTKGYQGSLSLRNSLFKTGKDDFFKTIKKSFSDNIEVSNESIDNLQLLDTSIKVSYDLTLNNEDEDILYFNPMLANQQKENPFAAAERYYPVEMPYCTDEVYVLTMEIPKGYEVDDLPKSARVMLNENEGMFEYIIAKSGDLIQFRSRIKLEKAIYEPEDYQTLRDFYGYLVKKEAEQIVFKKIK